MTKSCSSVQGTEAMGQGCSGAASTEGRPVASSLTVPLTLSAWPAGLLPRGPRAAARAEIYTRFCHQHVPTGRNDIGLWGPAQLQGHPCSVTRRLLTLASLSLPVGSSPHSQFWELYTLIGLMNLIGPKPHMAPQPHPFSHLPKLSLSFFFLSSCF